MLTRGVLKACCLVDSVLDQVGPGHHDLEEGVEDALAAGHHLQQGVLEGGLLGDPLAKLLVCAQQNLLREKKNSYPRKY